MYATFDKFIRSLSVGTAAQNIKVYSLIGVMLLIILVQQKVIAGRKKKKL